MAHLRLLSIIGYCIFFMLQILAISPSSGSSGKKITFLFVNNLKSCNIYVPNKEFAKFHLIEINKKS